MCARIFYLILAALFVFLVITVAAFVYLEWWQALLVSAATFLLLLLGGKWLAQRLIQSALGRFGEMAKGMFDLKSRVLRNATVDLHRVQPSAPPDELVAAAEDPDAEEFDRAEILADLQNLQWYEIEATIFPDPSQAGPMSHWDLDDLRLVPANAVPPSPFSSDDDEEVYELYGLRLVLDGEPVPPEDGKVSGPQRLRFVTGVPRSVRELQFRYYFEQFGPFRLPPALPAARTP